MRARCVCGGLAASADVEPLFVIACHCRDCQRRTGAAFGLGAYYDRAAVTIDGAFNEYARGTDSGGTLRARFCPTCGTSLSWTIDAHPGLVAVAVGAMDAPPAVAVHSLWERTQHAGVVLADATEHYARGYPPR